MQFLSQEGADVNGGLGRIEGQGRRIKDRSIKGEEGGRRKGGRRKAGRTRLVVVG
jgi:hypothetical protein